MHFKTQLEYVQDSLW